MKLDDHTKITVSIGIVYGAICSVVAAAAVCSASYISILNRIDRIAGDSLTHLEFQSWVDSFREANPSAKVPAVPQKRSDAGSPALAVVARTEARPEE